MSLETHSELYLIKSSFPELKNGEKGLGLMGISKYGVGHLISVGYKPPPPAFQTGKVLVGKVSARQNLP
jgi:hypothetical protein